MGILLDLINVSVDDADLRDVRQPRTRQELEQGSVHRPRLLEELINARLLAAASETRNGVDVEVIDIIHESLIENWARLRNAIDEQRQQLQRRARFKLWLGEWLRSGQQDGYLLLTDMQLAEARVLVEGRDIEVQGAEAREFYRRSVEYQVSIQRAKDKAEAEHKARQRWLRQIAVALVIMVVAAGIALWQWQRAETAKVVAETARNESDRLKEQVRADQIAQKAALSNIDTTLEQYPQRSLLLAVESAKMLTAPIPSSLETLYDLLVRIHGTGLSTPPSVFNMPVVSPDGKMMASISANKTTQVWSLIAPNREPILLKELNDMGEMVFSPNNEILAINGENGIHLWSLLESDQEPLTLKNPKTDGFADDVLGFTFSPNGKMLAAGSLGNTIRLWTLDKPGIEPISLEGHEDRVMTVAFSPDSMTLVSGSWDKTVRLWSLVTPNTGRPLIFQSKNGI